MASQAAIDGIAANGLAWKTQGPSIRHLCKRIGRFRDSQDYNPASLVSTAHAIAAEINKWLARQPADEAEDFVYRHGEDIENMQELTVDDASDNAELEEIVFALGNIFDTFDYWRVLVR